MTDRLQFHEALPDTYKRLLNLNSHVERMAAEHEVPVLLLELVKAVCHLPGSQEVRDEVYDAAADLFDTEQLAVVTWAIAVIQTFNALNVTGRKPLPR